MKETVILQKQDGTHIGIVGEIEDATEPELYNEENKTYKQYLLVSVLMSEEQYFNGLKTKNPEQPKENKVGKILRKMLPSIR